MLEWVYSNRIRNFKDCSAQDAMDLLRLSDKWLLRDLKRICELKLIPMVQVENCAKLLCATHSFDAKRLRTATVKFIMDHVKEVTSSKVRGSARSEAMSSQCKDWRRRPNALVLPIKMRPLPNRHLNCHPSSYPFFRFASLIAGIQGRNEGIPSALNTAPAGSGKPYTGGGGIGKKT